MDFCVAGSLIYPICPTFSKSFFLEEHSGPKRRYILNFKTRWDIWDILFFILLILKILIYYKGSTTEMRFRKILKVGNQWEVRGTGWDKLNPNGKFRNAENPQSAPVGLEMVCPVGQVFRATNV